MNRGSYAKAAPASVNPPKPSGNSNKMVLVELILCRMKGQDLGVGAKLFETWSVGIKVFEVEENLVKFWISSIAT